MDNELMNDLAETHRELNLVPELAFDEFETSELIASHLNFLSIPFQLVNNTTIIATLKKGEGPEIILNAYIDAQPISTFPTQDHGSLRQKANHNQGHDFQITMLIGAAYNLKNNAFQGTIKFIFQTHEKQTPTKSLQMPHCGNIKAMITLHMEPLLKEGKLAFLDQNKTLIKKSLISLIARIWGNDIITDFTLSNTIIPTTKLRSNINTIDYLFGTKNSHFQIQGYNSPEEKTNIKECIRRGSELLTMSALHLITEKTY
ncbi:hypothetical protein ACFP1I_30035 [Dyadobacter subterraneus]|uniref:Uncharacterized protein n=1 Tax=Dyadobacter subterraneus TaxID=2773304 RepID=A0ABR9WMA6_9BACT|nr:hypothetical protein [Dyadobacter subterraneus]MBE9466649.1 hypothetical protein [Dyadobacter subterraneus]